MCALNVHAQSVENAKSRHSVTPKCNLDRPGTRLQAGSSFSVPGLNKRIVQASIIVLALSLLNPGTTEQSLQTQRPGIAVKET